MEDIRRVRFAVEANNFEQGCLWERHNKKVSWVEIPENKMICVGQFAKRDIIVWLSWATIDGHDVLFYDATSRVVNYNLVESWIEENALVPGGRMEDAMNFGLVLRDIETENKRRNAINTLAASIGAR